ncbi:hypothetical protein NDU88_003442 [Pleurodeles waltl]|uniref:Uncharacterized protein n=1 Tax=Pleurodeles waltl TaxID=8319 RepID=A0AAV7NGW7_PLEWA|nr:hypothetical protein NDU88_003442 [Pleurodeles waltl]
MCVACVGHVWMGSGMDGRCRQAECEVVDAPSPRKETWGFTAEVHLDHVCDSDAVCLWGRFSGPDLAAGPVG